MKFSQLVIASAAIAAGVEGFSTSKLSVVRQVSTSSLCWICCCNCILENERTMYNIIGTLCGCTHTSHQLKNAQDMRNSALHYTMDNEMYI